MPSEPIPFEPSLRTARLELRKPRRSDAGSIFRNYATDPEVTHYLSWEPHRSVADTHEFLAGLLERWDAGQEASWVLLEPGSPDAIGMISASFDLHGAMVGYVLMRARWGRGYMSEALTAVSEYCLARPEVWRVWAYCAVDNRPSARVMEKAGLTLEGTLRRWARRPGRDPDDCLVYARVR